VGGGILTHGIPPVHHLIEDLAKGAGEVPGVGGGLGALTPTLLDGVAGFLAGGLVVAAVTLVRRLLPRKPPPAPAPS
jgi:uncharacterized protein